MAELSLVHDADNPQLSLRDAAIEFADSGLRIFPITPKQKAPALLNSWPTRATDDKDQITAWWNKWPEANIGILTGKKSGIFVVDIDPKNGGDESITKLLKNKEFPDTATVRTGSGGSHLFFKYPDGEKLRTRRGFPGVGIDICSNGGYVVAAASVHPNGTPYRWASNRNHIANAPLWLLELLLSEKKQPVNTDGAIHVGVRNNELYRIGCSLRGKGIKAKGLGAELHKINRYQCEVPLSDDEVNSIIDSVNQFISGGKPPVCMYRDFIRSNEFPKIPALRHIAHAISFYMSKEGDSAYPTQQQLADDTGYSRETVSRNLQIAKKKGLILVVKHKVEGQKHPNNIYFLPKRFIKSCDPMRHVRDLTSH
jgi:biotin operon repressor